MMRHGDRINNAELALTIRLSRHEHDFDFAQDPSVKAHQYFY